MQVVIAETLGDAQYVFARGIEGAGEELLLRDVGGYHIVTRADGSSHSASLDVTSNAS
jgi:hypothetical protein